MTGDPFASGLARAPSAPLRAGGNADTQTFGFKNTLRRNWTAARARLRVDGIRARTGGDRIPVVDPGLRFVPGGLPDEFETAVAHADGAPDVEQYFVEGRRIRKAGL